ncbi:peptidylprolyl isomerase [Cylindrospermopsis raciborskii CENA303]|uniref:peptidylprolyl isomerase n=1 Tax=Cylindrospermopsis raciborskii CENA303 TaxID=1170769 RepID=A0A1X4G9G6_9CYAN|nr:peptidylprolyl isomerase [Cylindrospermopsis raciborskii]EFA73737.1 PpiC-type peptidyl-prolyl cis-trans isomerase [Raphidiopsis brookii D9]OSO93811.1 peptidylprolyl isomerase [Cylindrospermopsis raciborskii CENA303]
MNPVLQFRNFSGRESYHTLTAPEVLKLLNKYQLIPMFLQEVIMEQAIAQISCTPEEERLAYEQLTQEYQGQKEQGISQEQLQNMATRQLKLERFKEVTWAKDIDSYFYQRKPQLDRVIYSLITTNDRGVAQEIYFRVQEGEQSFAQLAQEYSQGPEAKTSGLVGPVELQSLHPLLVRILSTSQPQQLSLPTAIEDWIVIVRLEKMLPAQLDSGMRQRLINERFQSWLKAQVSPQNWQIKESEN